MNSRTVTHGTITGLMCSLCGLVCQRLAHPADWGQTDPTARGGLNAHRTWVHGTRPKPAPDRRRPA